MRPLYERWLDARASQRHAQTPAGRYVNDIWVSA